MNLYFYQVSDTLSYKKNRLDALGIYLKGNGIIYQGGTVKPHNNELFNYHLLLDAFLTLLETKLPEKHNEVIKICSISTPWLLTAFKVATDTGENKTIPSTEEAKKCVERINASPFTFELKDMELIKVEDFNGEVGADSAADSAIIRYERTGEAFYVNHYIEKDLRKKETSNHPMLVDNLVIDRLRDDNVYYCGVGNLDKRAPKVDQTIDEVVRKREDASHVYFTGNNSRLRNFGMYSANERYHVLILNDNIPYLQKVFNFQRNINAGIHQIKPETVFRLKEITGAGVNYPVSNDDFDLIGITESGDLYANSFKRRDLSYVMSPPRLKFKVLREYDWAEEVLRRFIGGDDSLHITEVTDYFYQKDSKDTPILNPDRNKDEERIVFDGIKYEDGVTKIIAMGKITMPTYQEFKRWVKLEPQVWINTHKVDEHLIRYTFIIKTTLGYLHYTCPVGGVKVLRKASKKARGINNDKKSRSKRG